MSRRRVLAVAVAALGAATAVAAPLAEAAPSAFPPPCPTQQLVYRGSNGDIIVSAPDPTGTRCRDDIDTGVYLPPL